MASNSVVKNCSLVNFVTQSCKFPLKRLIHLEMSLRKNQSAMAAPRQVSAFAAFKARAKEALGMQSSEVEAVQTLSISKLVDNYECKSTNTLTTPMSRSKSERRKLTVRLVYGHDRWLFQGYLANLLSFIFQKAEKRQKRLSLPDAHTLHEALPPRVNGNHQQSKMRKFVSVDYGLAEIF